MLKCPSSTLVASIQLNLNVNNLLYRSDSQSLIDVALLYGLFDVSYLHFDDDENISQH